MELQNWLQPVEASLSYACPLPLVAVASLLLFGIYKWTRRPSGGRQPISNLTSVRVEKPEHNHDAPPSYAAHSFEEHGRSLSGSSLTRRNTSVSGRSRDHLFQADRTGPSTAFPATLQDIPLDAKINSLRDYVQSQGDGFVFNAPQSERLARLRSDELDTFWLDLYCEMLRRQSDAPTHQVLQLCPTLHDGRKEAIRRMAAIGQPVFVDMARDLLYELERRRRQTTAPDAQRASVLPPDVLVRTDIDWKGHDKRQFGRLRIEEAELVRIKRGQPSKSHLFQCHLFDCIFLAFQPDIVPVLKGRVFTFNMCRLEGYKSDKSEDPYRLTLSWKGFDRAEPETMTMVFKDRATWDKWATELRDAILREKLARTTAY